MKTVMLIIFHSVQQSALVHLFDGGPLGASSGLLSTAACWHSPLVGVQQRDTGDQSERYLGSHPADGGNVVARVDEVPRVLLQLELPQPQVDRLRILGERERQTHRLRARQAGGHTDRQMTNGKEGGQTDRQTRQTHREAYR